MPYYFQVKGSTNLNKIAVVGSVANANSFRTDSNWYEITEGDYLAMFNKEEIKDTPKKEVKRKTKDVE